MQEKITFNELLAKAKELKAMMDKFNKDLSFFQQVQLFVTDNDLECAAYDNSWFDGEDVMVDGVHCTTPQGRMNTYLKRQAELEGEHQ